MSAKDGAMIKQVRHSQLPPNSGQGAFVSFVPILKVRDINDLRKPVGTVLCQPLTSSSSKYTFSEFVVDVNDSSDERPGPILPGWVLEGTRPDPCRRCPGQGLSVTNAGLGKEGRVQSPLHLQNGLS